MKIIDLWAFDNLILDQLIFRYYKGRVIPIDLDKLRARKIQNVRRRLPDGLEIVWLNKAEYKRLSEALRTDYSHLQEGDRAFVHIGEHYYDVFVFEHRQYWVLQRFAEDQDIEAAIYKACQENIVWKER